MMTDPDPRPDDRQLPAAVSSGITDLSVFSNLPSIQAARKESYRLNIAYDCEYKRVPGSDYRMITSYQFAVFLPDEKQILEVIFISLIADVRNRLYLRTALGAILDLLDQLGAIEVITAAYKVTRRWTVSEHIPYFDGAEETYRKKHTFRDIDEAQAFRSWNPNPLVVVDSKAYKSNDFSEFKKNEIPLEIAIICHAGIVDLPAFKDDIFAFGKKKGNIIPYLNSMQGGLTSTSPYFINIPTPRAYWKFYPVNVVFRDTMCCAPAGKKALASLGASIEVPKIILPDGAIENMDLYLREFPEDYEAYAAQDALVTLMYGSRLWGVNSDWPLTSTSGACFAMKESIGEYMKIPRDRNGKIDRAAACLCCRFLRRRFQYLLCPGRILKPLHLR